MGDNLRNDLKLKSERYPPALPKMIPKFQPASVGILSRTQSGTFIKPEAPLPLPADAPDPRVSNWKPTGVLDASGQVMLFQDSGIDVSDDAGPSSTSTSPRTLDADAKDSRLNRFLTSLLTRASEELKEELFESRERLMLAAGMTISIEQDQLQGIISSHSPQIVHMSLQLVWTASIEQMFELSVGSSGSLTRNLEAASKGIVATLDALLDRGSRMRMKNFNVIKRVAGVVVKLLSLRDATDSLINSELGKRGDFAWLKLPRFYWDNYLKTAWLSLLDTTLPCRHEWQGSNPHLIVLTPNAERTLMGITQAVSVGRGAWRIIYDNRSRVTIF
jgi:hypothetical protein